MMADDPEYQLVRVFVPTTSNLWLYRGPGNFVEIKFDDDHEMIAYLSRETQLNYYFDDGHDYNPSDYHIFIQPGEGVYVCAYHFCEIVERYVAM